MTFFYYALQNLQHVSCIEINIAHSYISCIQRAINLLRRQGGRWTAEKLIAAPCLCLHKIFIPINWNSFGCNQYRLDLWLCFAATYYIL